MLLLISSKPDDMLISSSFCQGVTLENTEKPKCGSDEECLSIIEKLESGERPLDLTGHGADPKCRYVH
jgi:hypothetical protein